MSDACTGGLSKEYSINTTFCCCHLHKTEYKIKISNILWLEQLSIQDNIPDKVSYLCCI